MDPLGALRALAAATVGQLLVATAACAVAVVAVRHAVDGVALLLDGAVEARWQRAAVTAVAAVLAAGAVGTVGVVLALLLGQLRIP